MILNFFSSAILFTSIANATKLVEPVTPAVTNTPSVATVATTPALHHDDNQFLGQADTWSEAKCWRTRNMIKEPPYSTESFYSLTNRLEDPKLVYSESHADFKHGSQVLYWADQEEGEGSLANKEKVKKITWERAMNAFPDASLFGQRGVTVDDVSQGSIGNCWLCAAFASLAENPLAVHRAFLNTKREQSPTGFYGVNLFVLGHPMTFTVDDYLPIVTKPKGEKTTIFSQIASDGSLWVPILEKVFAKRYGNYQHLILGNGRDGLQALTGGPSIHLQHNQVDAETLWNLLLQHDTEGDYMQCGTAGSDDQTQNRVGLAMGHAYTVLEAKELTKGKNKGTQLIKVRNPWGSEKYEGPWSDKSELWDDDSKKEVQLVEDDQDGLFWIDIDTYLSNFSETFINYDAYGWAESKFLMIQDETPDSPGTVRFCGPTCTRHTFTLTSTVKQKVFVTAHTWQDRSFSEECEVKKAVADDEPKHFIQVDGGFCLVFESGDRRAAPIDMEAGQTIEINTEWNFADGLMPKDWSVITQGNGAWGSLTLKHTKGLQTQSWRPMKRSQELGDKPYWSKKE